jgi:hypothetical protein
MAISKLINVSLYAIDRIESFHPKCISFAFFRYGDHCASRNFWFRQKEPLFSEDGGSQFFLPLLLHSHSQSSDVTKKSKAQHWTIIIS